MKPLFLWIGIGLALATLGCPNPPDKLPVGDVEPVEVVDATDTPTVQDADVPTVPDADTPTVPDADTPDPGPTDPCEGNDGNPCDDGNACTENEQCQDGVCAGGTPITCTASDACHTVANAECTDPVGGCAEEFIGQKICGEDGDCDGELLDQHEQLTSPESCDDGNDIPTDGCDACEIKEFEVTPGAEFAAETQTLPRVAVTTNGGYVVAFLASANNVPKSVRVIKFDAEGTPIFDDLLEGVESGYGPDVAAGPAGGFVVAHDESWGQRIKFRTYVSTDTIQQAGVTTVMDENNVPTDNKAQGAVRISDLFDGTHLVVWPDNSTGLGSANRVRLERVGGPEADFMMHEGSTSGAGMDHPVLVDVFPENADANAGLAALAYWYRPDTGASTKPEVVATAVDGSSLETKTDYGGVMGVPNMTNPDEPEVEMVALKNGKIAVLWTDKHSPPQQTVVKIRLVKANGELDSTIHDWMDGLTNPSASLTYDSEIAATAVPDGLRTVAICSATAGEQILYSVGMRHLSLDGTPGGMLNRANKFTDLPVHTPHIDAYPDGGFVVVWSADTAAGTPHIFVQRYNADGSKRYR